MDAASRERYSRQILFPGIGEAGQEALLASRVAIVGCGALGSFHAAALARAGVGKLTLIDRDFVEPSNLHRQWLFEESDAAQSLPKAIAAARRIAAINSSIDARGIVADITAANIAQLLEGAQLILDGTDNFDARYLINDFAVSRGLPWVYGAAVGSYGISMPVVPGRTPCLRCVYPEPPPGAQPTCETAGVLNVIVSVIASLQAADALKILCGRADCIRARLTTVDIWDGRIRQIEAPPRDTDCPCCVRREYPYLAEGRRPPVTLCGRDAIQIHDRERKIDLGDLKSRLESLGEVRASEYVLRFRVPPYDLTLFPDGRAIVKGTADPAVARSLYAKYF
ncbi:MAG TPA: ThiF family adenylyltransferase [Verrucomicrobiae bacterium]|nr:ThiF family adenylyltransferase [Verrucomicrobiae bacterium]